MGFRKSTSSLPTLPKLCLLATIFCALTAPAAASDKNSKKKAASQPISQPTAADCPSGVAGQASDETRPQMLANFPLDIFDATKRQAIVDAAVVLEAAMRSAKTDPNHLHRSYLAYLRLCQDSLLLGVGSEVAELFQITPHHRASPADFVSELFRAGVSAQTSAGTRPALHKAKLVKLQAYDRWLEGLMMQTIQFEDFFRTNRRLSQMELTLFWQAVTGLSRLYMDWHGLKYDVARTEVKIGEGPLVSIEALELNPGTSTPSERKKGILRYAGLVRNYGETSTRLLYCPEYLLRSGISSDLSSESRFFFSTRLLVAGESQKPLDLFHTLRLYEPRTLRLQRYALHGQLTLGSSSLPLDYLYALLRSGMALGTLPDGQLTELVSKSFRQFEAATRAEWNWPGFESTLERVGRYIGDFADSSKINLELLPGQSNEQRRTFRATLDEDEALTISLEKEETENRILVSLKMRDGVKFELWINNSSAHREIFPLAQLALETELLEGNEIKAGSTSDYVYYGVVGLIHEAYRQLRHLHTLRVLAERTSYWLEMKVMAPQLRAAKWEESLAATERNFIQGINEAIGEGVSHGNRRVLSQVADVFKVATLVDERERRLSEKVTRRGADEFRENVVRAYDGRCAISGSEVEELLQAAHIVNYWGPKTNVIANGILMRQDLHTLYDRQLISIDPENYELLISSSLKRQLAHPSSPFDHLLLELEGKAINVPSRSERKPSKEALSLRHTAFLVSQYVSENGKLPASNTKLGREMKKALRINADVFVVITYSPRVRVLLEDFLKAESESDGDDS